MIYQILGWLAVLFTPVAPAFFFGWRVYSAVWEMTQLNWLALVVGLCAAVGLEAIGIFAGIYLLKYQSSSNGITLMLFCCASMFAASIVLLVSKPNMLRGVFIQGLCPLLAILTWWLFKNQ